MNDNARKWIEALRSGRFAQAINYLEIGDRFCCLGVACVVARENGVPVERDADDDDFAVRYGGRDQDLPTSVQKWLGLRTNNGEWHGHISDCLTDMNDGGATFKEIADKIESEPEGLFVDG